jgi:hypothetical protein
MKFIAMTMLFLASATAFAKNPTLYFSCNVQEEVSVNVRFAIGNYEAYSNSGELLEYPGTEEYILVSPEETAENGYTRMSNLLAQGGDLRFYRDGSVLLWGDGDGYQFTDLRLWDLDSVVSNLDDEEEFVVEGYVRDYGPAYRGEIDFKQFITCKVSTRVL